MFSFAGDAYRYTVAPNFPKFNEFNCHIRHKPPKILYTMFFHIKIPGPYGPQSELETPHVQKTIYAHDFGGQRTGSYRADYIDIEHTSGLDLHEEFILHGKEIRSQNERKVNYTINSLKSKKEYVKSPIAVHKMADNVYVANVQFDAPFAYSTSSWVKDIDCDKDISKFKVKQPHSRNDAQNVNVVVHNSQTPFKYSLKSLMNPPYIRFVIPGKF